MYLNTVFKYNLNIILPCSGVTYSYMKTEITSNELLKNKFREAERTSIKLIETESHRSFNECCLINNLLIIYT